MKSVMDKAKKAGLTPEEIAKKLGIEEPKRNKWLTKTALML